MNDKHLDIAIRYKQAAPGALLMNALRSNFGKQLGASGMQAAQRAMSGFLPGAGMGAVGGFMMPGTGGKDMMGRDMPVSFGDRLSGALRGGLYGGVLGAAGNAAFGKSHSYNPGAVKPGQLLKRPAAPVQTSKPAQPAQTPPPTSAGRGQTAPAQQQKAPAQQQKAPAQQQQAPAQQQKAPAAGNRQYGTDAPLGGVDLKRGVPTNTQPQNQASGNRRVSKSELTDLQAQRRMPVDNSWNWKTPAMIAGGFGLAGIPLAIQHYNKNASVKASVMRRRDKYRAKIAALGLLQPLGIGLGLAGLGFGAYKLHQENKKTPGGLQLNPFNAINNTLDNASNAQKGK